MLVAVAHGAVETRSAAGLPFVGTPNVKCSRRGSDKRSAPFLKSSKRSKLVSCLLLVYLSDSHRGIRFLVVSRSFVRLGASH